MVMDLFSPKPEHTQLNNDTINPKNERLPKIIPSGSFNAVTSTVVNKTKSSAESNGLGFLLPPLPLHTSSITNYNLDNTTVSESTVNLSSSSSTNLQKNPGFPSPPQSPKLLNERKTQKSKDKTRNSDEIAPPVSSINEGKHIDVTRFNLDKDIFLVRPNWEQGLDLTKYRRSNRRFMSYYCIFKDKDKDSASVPPFQREYRYSLRNNRYRNTKEDVDHYYDGSIPSQRLAPNSKCITLSFATDKEPNILKQGKKWTTKTSSIGSSPKKVMVYSHNHTTPNINWELLPDYSPSWDTLPTTNINKSMRVEWKGSMMDLSNDPLRDKLHPAELNLAQILRLPCSLYLDSKRRLFMSKVERMQQGLPFRRTDAQKACHIDVNKASRLYSAYEKVGWLDDKLFTKYL